MAYDRTGKRLNWTKARNAEGSYNRKLQGVARQVGELIRGFAPDGVVRNMARLQRALEQYAELIEPWADAVGSYMVADVRRRNEQMWKATGSEIGRGLRIEMAYSDQGAVFREARRRQVDLITSLPRKAGQRVIKLTEEALYTGRRAESIAQEILESGKVTQSRARLIARTEVSTTSFEFLRARAERAGSPGYFWRTSEDADVRSTHQAVNGDFIRWDAPPKTDANLAPYHAGCGPNCRCWAEPTFPDL